MPNPPVSTLRRILLTISSPWTSLALLALVFVHQSVGSAFYPLRQAFELNEMQWFNGPLTAVLWSAVCVCLITASIVRVPWTWARGGAHLTHLSVVLLVIASAIYFGYKIEGETLLLRRGIELVDQSGNRAFLLPNPGYAAVFGDATARVDSVIPAWSVLTPDGKSQRAWAVMVTIRFPDGKPFTATLIADRPELTQYTQEGRTPTSYLPQVSAVDAVDGVVRALGADQSVKVQTKAEVGASATNDGWSLSVTALDPNWPLLANGHQGEKATLVSFTIKTPEGQQSGNAILGRPELTRFQRARTKQVPDPRLASATLVPAPVQRAYHQDRFAVWSRTAPLDEAAGAHRSYLVHPLNGLPRYHDHGRRSDGVPLNIAAGAIDTGKTDRPADLVTFTVTGFAPYAAPVIETREDPSRPLDPQLDVVFLSRSNDAVPRTVKQSSDPAMVDSQGLCWIKPADQAGCDAVRAALAVRAAKPVNGSPEPESVRLVFLSGPNSSFDFITCVPGQPLSTVPASANADLPVTIGEASFTLRLRGIYQHPREELIPIPVPPDQRQSRMSVGMNQAWIEVEARKGNGEVARQWVTFSPFPELPVEIGERSTVLGSYAPKPTLIDVPGAGRYELLFSRVPFDIPGPIWMTDFTVPRRPGSDDPMEFFCAVAYGDPKQPGTATVHMNDPLEWNGVFFFQAGWDPSQQALSVLGVGNRPGGWFLLLSSIMLGVGMVWSGMGMARGRKS